MFREMEKKKEKADQNAVAELTREWLYKENKWLWEENRKLKEMSGKLWEMNGKLWEWVNNLEEENKKLKEELEWYKTEHERLVDKLVIKWATELLDRKFENKKWWQWE